MCKREGAIGDEGAGAEIECTLTAASSALLILLMFRLTLPYLVLS